jgi:hypothetical protein
MGFIHPERNAFMTGLSDDQFVCEPGSPFRYLEKGTD